VRRATAASASMKRGSSVERLDPPLNSRPAASACSRAPIVDVVEDLEVVGQELDRRDEDAPVALRRELRHEIGEVGRHPLTRLVAGALPAERPALRADPGGARR
jgi:hypothetical protein